MKYIEPEFLFETSWEVCNKVGGIYAVLSTRARSMSERYGDNVVFVGPLFPDSPLPHDFVEEEWDAGFSAFVACEFALTVKIGRWGIPGNARVILVDFSPLYEIKNEIYTKVWNDFGVDSLHAYGDYDEAAMFGCAAGRVMHAFYNFFSLEGQRVTAHFNEWMTGFGLFYLKKALPSVATLFTTHATTVGRSIAGNGKPLYDYMDGYFGDQMALELNVESKHSVEKQAALNADCFTTVSDITNAECAQLLGRPADVVTPNGFEFDFVPPARVLAKLRTASRLRLAEVAERVLGYELPHDTVFCATSGRYEYKNKGIDLFVDALDNLSRRPLCHPVVAFLFVPNWQLGPCSEWSDENRFSTHRLGNPGGDPLLTHLRACGFSNSEQSKVKVISVPAYLTGDDGVVDLPYFEALAGVDFTIFPSYYEPWGYTPMESAAFAVPTVTSDLAGFGLWTGGGFRHLADGAAVIHRTDSNYRGAAAAIADECEAYIALVGKKADVKAASAAAQKLARKAQWRYFFKYYQQAYHVALTNQERRKIEMPH